MTNALWEGKLRSYQPRQSGSSRPTIRLVSAPPKSALGDIKALLARALDEAKAADELMVAYFIEMAIAEVRERGAETRLESADRTTLVRRAE
jgi:hypothetical protein